MDAFLVGLYFIIGFTVSVILMAIDIATTKGPVCRKALDGTATMGIATFFAWPVILFFLAIVGSCEGILWIFQQISLQLNKRIGPDNRSK